MRHEALDSRAVLAVGRMQAHSERFSYYLAKSAEPLSRLGERYGQEWLVYNPLIMLWFHLNAVQNADSVVRAMTAEFPGLRSVADVGAGSGAYAAAARRLGFEVSAFEHSALGRAMARVQGVRSLPFDLDSGPLPEVRADLAYCFEVAEHLPAWLGDRLVRLLSAAAPLVVFTAARPGQGGTGHVNEQPKEYWIERFRACGQEFDERASERMARRLDDARVTAWWLPQNVTVFHAAR
jgi:SAM-dependent methyltransferase